MSMAGGGGTDLNPGQLWDAIVAGAGPAGSTAAALLAERGLRVLVVDRAIFPRDKMCGEYLGAGCVQLLAGFGVELPDTHPIRAMRVTAPDGTVFNAPYPEGRSGLAIRRSQLDALLLENARRKGAACLEGFRVERLLLKDGKVQGVEGRLHGGEEKQFLARIVIGAEGRNSVVARHLGLFRWNRSHRRTALGLHYEGVLPINGFAEVFLGAGLYGILNPLGAGAANLSLVVDYDSSLSKDHAGAYFAEALGRLPALQERVAQARPLEEVKVLGPMAHHAARASADGALLAGDAAGFYDPFTGEGVYMALISAGLAAKVAGEALWRGDCSARFLRSYDRERSAALGGRYRLEAAIQRVIRHPRTADLVSRRLREREDAASRLMEVLGGLAWPRALLSGRVLAAFL